VSLHLIPIAPEVGYNLGCRPDFDSLFQVYFINHRYDGVQLWQVQSVPGVHQLVWLSSLISFLFLYPSTFNLLEVAAVDKPKLHLWETGIMRITRHPQVFINALLSLESLYLFSCFFPPINRLYSEFYAILVAEVVHNCIHYYGNKVQSFSTVRSYILNIKDLGF